MTVLEIEISEKGKRVKVEVEKLRILEVGRVEGFLFPKGLSGMKGSDSD